MCGSDLLVGRIFAIGTYVFSLWNHSNLPSAELHIYYGVVTFMPNACMLPYNCHIFPYQVGCGYPKLIKNDTIHGFVSGIDSTFITGLLLILLYALFIMPVE
jgi:hypothetical protein